MSLTPAVRAPAGASFLQALAAQMRVIGAIMMRELHTRYGRENIGYLWLIGEPLMLAGVIASLHTSGHTEYGSDIRPLPFSVLGYTLFIAFRGVVNRSEGTMESNGPLLYHRMVTIFDIVTARALIETAGCLLAFVTLISFLTGLGLASYPVRPLAYFGALGLMFWCAFGHSLIVTAISHDSRTVARFVHPYSYFMIPLSASFFQVAWVPEPFRSYLLWLPLPHIFELARYGQFRSANLNYFDGGYVVFVNAVLTWIGLVLVRRLRSRIHL